MNEQHQTEPQPDQTTRPVLSRISIGRVFNLGNYEHVRYEITLDVLPGMCPHTTLLAAQKIIKNLEPIKRSHEEIAALRVLNTDTKNVSEYELSRIDHHRGVEERFQEKLKKQKDVLELLKTLGGSGTFKDAKQEWEDPNDDETYF